MPFANPNNNKKRRILSLRQMMYWIGLALGGGLLLSQLIESIRALARKSISGFQFDSLALAFLLMILIYAIQMLIWRESMAGIGVSLPVRSILRKFWLSYLGRYIPGTVWGYLGRNEWLYKEFGVSYGYSNSGSLFETGFVLLGGLVIFACGELWRGPWQIQALLVIMIVPILSWFIIRQASRWKIPENVSRLVPSFVIQYSLENMTLLRWFCTLVFSMTNWFLFGVCINLCLESLSIPLDFTFQSTLFISSPIYAIAWMIGFFVLIVPGGLGVREVALTGLLAAFYAIPIDVSSIIAILMRLLGILAEFIWIFIGLISNRSRA
ncbi:MAG TPA: lysylphosphatidylglycerol synthase domain-containing protein [Anaerolineaceae bacterium]